MSLICPTCGKREFGIAKMMPSRSFTRKPQKAVYKCKACGYKEVIG